MTRQHDSTSLVEEWLSDGPDVAPDRVLAEVAGKLGRTRQEGTFLMNGFGRVGVFATAAAVAVGALLVGYLLSRDNGSVGPPPSPSPTGPAAFADSDVLGYLYGSELWVAAEDGSGAHSIADNVDLRGVAWSPDGQRLAFVRDGMLFVIAADGSVNQVTDETDAFDGPSWSPDGTQIVGNGSAPGGSDGLVIVDVDLGTAQAVPKAIECMGSPDWGSSGLIVFTGATTCSKAESRRRCTQSIRMGRT